MKVVKRSSQTCHSTQFCALIPNMQSVRRFDFNEGSKNREKRRKPLKMSLIGLSASETGFSNAKSEKFSEYIGLWRNVWSI